MDLHSSLRFVTTIPRLELHLVNSHQLICWQRRPPLQPRNVTIAAFLPYIATCCLHPTLLGGKVSSGLLYAQSLISQGLLQFGAKLRVNHESTGMKSSGNRRSLSPSRIALVTRRWARIGTALPKRIWQLKSKH